VVPHGDYGALAARAGPGDRERARSGLGIPTHALTALVFGQLRPDKGIDELLDAARSIPELHVLLAGEDHGVGPLIEHARADPSLAYRLHVVEGYQPLANVADWFAAADVGVHAYRVASQSGVLLLSYAFATPAIVYPAGGMPEVVEDGVTGWVTDTPATAALVRALREAVAEGPLGCAARGRAGAALVGSRFGWDAIASSTAAMYEEAAG
jgi:glycosyltransferase involved in cell wall biosynthesis